MTATVGDLIPRDQYGRPQIEHPVSGRKISYTRASTMAKAITDTYNLEQWAKRQVAIGMATRKDLIMGVRAAAADANPRAGKNRLNALVEQAMEASKSSAGATIGTALHSMCEQVDAGASPADVAPDEFVPDLDAYRTEIARQGLAYHASEQFVCVDDILCAGSFDRIGQFPSSHPWGRYGPMVVDLKTGQWEIDYPHSASVQMAIYAHGNVLGSDFKRRGLLSDNGVSTSKALMIWLPSGQAKVEFGLVDIETGWQMARVAAGVRQWWKNKSILERMPSEFDLTAPEWAI